MTVDKPGHGVFIDFDGVIRHFGVLSSGSRWVWVEGAQTPDMDPHGNSGGSSFTKYRTKKSALVGLLDHLREGLIAKPLADRADAEKLKLAMRTQELLHEKIGKLRSALGSVVAKNKVLRRKALMLQRCINRLNEQIL